MGVHYFFDKRTPNASRHDALPPWVCISNICIVNIFILQNILRSCDMAVIFSKELVNHCDILTGGFCFSRYLIRCNFE